MLKRLYVKNFTVFAEANFEFGPGLNVVVGTNGTGKSHVLKLGYAVLRSLVSRLQQDKNAAFSMPDSPLTGLKNIFRPAPADVTELIRRHAAIPGAVIDYEIDDERVSPVRISISANFSGESSFTITPASAAAEIGESVAPPVLIPAKEILTLGWMTQASRQLKLQLDEAYLDLLLQLSGLPLQNPEPAATAALKQLTAILGGEIEEDNGRFYLVYPKEKRLEMNMVAEGLRKFGTLQKLLANGSLTPKTTLFWDEPEANLNPALLRKLAAVLAELARQGFQIIMATHSLFLLNELHILTQTQPTSVRYFGLYQAEGGDTKVEQTNDLEKLHHLVALDEEIAQTARFQRVLDNEDTHAEHN